MSLEDALAAFDERLDAESPAASEETPATHPPTGDSDLPPAQLDQVAEPPAQPETTEPQAEAQPRDEETGRFISKEQAAQLAEQDPEIAAFLAKYQGDPEQAFRAAVEAQKKIGQQGQELGELRQQVQQIHESVTREPEPQPIQLNDQVIDWFDEQLEQNAQGAAMWAKDNDPSGTLFNRAMEYWHEENPVAAIGYVMDERLKAQQAHYEQLLQQQTAPLQEVAQQNALTDAWNTVAAEHPDINEHSDKIFEAVREAPELAAPLKSPTSSLEERVAALKKLRTFAGGLAGVTPPAGGTPDESAEAAAAALSQQVRDAKLSGAVASQTTTSDPQQVDEGEAWLQRFYDPAAARFQHDE